MINNIKIYNIIIFSFLIFSFFILNIYTINIVSAEENYGLDATIGANPNLKVLTQKNDPQTIIGDLVGEILAFVGVLFLLLMIYAGFKYMFSMGNDSEVENAKNLIKYAIIGLIVILSAYAITSFIGTKLTT